MLEATVSSASKKPRLEDSWLNILEAEFAKPYMKTLKAFLQQEILSGKEIFPHPHQYFAALNSTPYPQVKVVILGQDPYHGPGQAHGLSFSVPKGIDPPPSLKNILKEISRDLKQPLSQSGDLGSWSRQGVLLLNTVLTVEKLKPASHQNKGWETFTDRIIEELNQKKQPLVFMLWGKFAQSKKTLIRNPQHLILESAHPSPLSAHRDFSVAGIFQGPTNFYKVMH